MPNDDTVLLVTGARALCDTAAARQWAQDTLKERVAALPRNACILAGGAPGPDAWAFEIGRTKGLTVVEYKLDGLRYVNGKIDESQREWPIPATLPTGSRPGEKGWPLVRNAAMVDGARKAFDAHWDVIVLALFAPWSTTRGTDHTASLAEKAGLEVIRETAATSMAP
jgi:hypothetical protein